MRRVGIFAFFIFSLMLFSDKGHSQAVEFFSQRPVTLSVTTLQPGAIATRSLNVESVKRAITRFMGDEKKAQIFLLQKFLTDAKSKVQMQIKVEEDIFEINNGVPQQPDTLYWTIRLSSDAKVQALLNIIDNVALLQGPGKKDG
ncbi:MAG: hypothetical protein U1F66_10925 [bacterium]